MRRTIDMGIRSVAILLVLAAVTACSPTPSDGDDNVVGDASPTVSVAAPADGATFASGATISFTGSADDAEDGDLTTSLAWTSNLDGDIGTGGDVSAILSDGVHVVAASVTDSVSQTANTSVTVTVGDGGGGEGGGGGGGETTGTRDIGFLVVDEVDSESGSVLVSGGGGFWRFDEDILEAFFDDPWGEIMGTCDVYTLSEEPIDPFQGLPTPDGLGFTPLGAGDPLEVTAGGTPYLSLDRFEESFGGETIVAYASASEIPGPLAEDLAVTVPGDEFPAVASAAFPNVAPFALTAPADPGAAGAVDVDTTFEWSGASGAANTIVTIDLFAPDTLTSVTCYAADTGSFTLPAATKTELGGTFSGSVERAGRESLRVETVGDARLVLAVARSQTFDVPTFVPFANVSDR